MHQKTINGVEVNIINLGPRGYLILSDSGESFITKEKPQTDQEVRMLQEELRRTREQIAILRAFT